MRRLPSDDDIWAERDKFSASTFAFGINSSAATVRAALAERGWGFGEKRGNRIPFDRAPCKHCGTSFPMDGREERLCDSCTPVEIHTDEPWRSNLEWARKRLAERDARHRDVA